MKITVFGGASPKENDPAYALAYALGFRLGSLGHSVITGGYHGSMQAVSQGASSTGVHVVGVTCQEIENQRPVTANSFISEEHKTKSLTARIDLMINLCDAAIALPGGIGTLAEIAVMWNRLILGSIKKKPLLLLGREWKNILQVFELETQHFVSRNDYELVMTMATIEEVIAILDSIESRKSNEQ